MSEPDTKSWEVHLPKHPSDHEQALDAGISATVNGKREIIAEVFGQVGLHTFIPAKAIAQRILSDHNACLGIIDPATTVSELVEACQQSEAAMAKAFDELLHSNTASYIMLSKAHARICAVLPKTGQKP